MAEIQQKYSLVDELRKADKVLNKDPSLLGSTCLTLTNYNNAMRSTMFTSHLNQFVTLDTDEENGVKPEPPYVFTNFENLVGKNSSGYKKLDYNYTVVKKVSKFKDLVDKPREFLLFVYNEDKDMYEVIKRKELESLTEIYGFRYNNDVIDNIEEGDKLEEGKVLYKSTSYDEYMNFSYGKNLNVIYTLHPTTSEDAARIRAGVARKMVSIESDTIVIGVNDNDYFINLYGDRKHYQPLPNIGDKVSDVIAGITRLFKSQLLADFKDESLMEIKDSDRIFYVDSNTEVFDYDIYDNRQEREEGCYFEQINKLVDSQTLYYKEILKVCKEIRNSGKNYSRDIDYYYKRAKEMLDDNAKWKDGNSVYPLEIHIHLKKRAPAAAGCKFTGRYGNKSVIAEIVADDEMPFTEDGRVVDVELNLLAIINRTASFTLYEPFINGCSYKIRKKMASMTNFKDKEELLFEYIGILNNKESKKLKAKYNKYSKKDKERYIEDAIIDGIYINQIPMMEDDENPIFYKCIELLNKYDFLTYDKLYIKKWGRIYPVLSNYVVGEMYFMKLKQTDKKGFSARSSGAIDNKSLPTKSFKSKSHQEKNSTKCIRFGESETLNFSIGILTEDIALFNALYRTSVKGRRDIIELMFSDPNTNAVETTIDDSYTSRVAEIFDVTLKSLGIKVEFNDDKNIIHSLNRDSLGNHYIDGVRYLCSDYEAFLLEKIVEIKDEILNENPVMTTSLLRDLIQDRLENSDYMDGDLDEEIPLIDKIVPPESIFNEEEKDLSDLISNKKTTSDKKKNSKTESKTRKSSSNKSTTKSTRKKK